MCSVNKRFKETRDTAHEGENSHPQMRACGADEAMSAVAFSGDGSLVAAAMPGSVTLWDPVANALVAVLAHPAAASSVSVSSLSFVACTPYLVSTLLTSLNQPRPLQPL